MLRPSSTLRRSDRRPRAGDGRRRRRRGRRVPGHRVRGLPTSEAVLEAVVAGAVVHAGDALAAARPGEGPPAEALERLRPPAGGSSGGCRHGLCGVSDAAGDGDDAVRCRRACHRGRAATPRAGRRDVPLVPSGELAGEPLVRTDPRPPGRGHRRRLAQQDAERVLASTVSDLVPPVGTKRERRGVLPRQGRRRSRRPSPPARGERCCTDG